MLFSSIIQGLDIKAFGNKEMIFGNTTYVKNITDRFDDPIFINYRLENVEKVSFYFDIESQLTEIF